MGRDTEAAETTCGLCFRPTGPQYSGVRGETLHWSHVEWNDAVYRDEGLHRLVATMSRAAFSVWREFGRTCGHDAIAEFSIICRSHPLVRRCEDCAWAHLSTFDTHCDLCARDLPDRAEDGVSPGSMRALVGIMPVTEFDRATIALELCNECFSMAFSSPE